MSAKLIKNNRREGQWRLLFEL